MSAEELTLIREMVNSLTAAALPAFMMWLVVKYALGTMCWFIFGIGFLLLGKSVVSMINSNTQQQDALNSIRKLAGAFYGESTFDAVARRIR